jgi:hypothetical protein
VEGEMNRRRTGKMRRRQRGETSGKRGKMSAQRNECIEG